MTLETYKYFLALAMEKILIQKELLLDEANKTTIIDILNFNSSMKTKANNIRNAYNMGLLDDLKFGKEDAPYYFDHVANIAHQRLICEGVV